ncbi:MAG: CDP-alcohol phosphatidyltransferase family protein [Mycobacteriales bacterium]
MTRAESRAEFRRRAVKPRDAWWTVLVIDPLALPVLSLLVRTRRVTPLKITIVAAVFGLGSVVAFFSGHLVVGAILFEIRFFLDCLDGKLARIRGLASSRGAFVDLTSDVVLISASIAGLGWHLAHAAPHVPLALSGSATFACLVLFWLILYDLDHPRAAVRTDVTAPSRIDRWLRHHRLVRLPRTVEIETLLLFVAPLTGSGLVLRVSFVIALAYYVVAAPRLFARLWGQTDPPGPGRDSATQEPG